jgi:hypothetical protein
MARGSIRRLSPWDAAVQELQATGSRYRLRQTTKSPYIYVRDQQDPSRREWSLKPLRQDSPEDIARAVTLIQSVGRGSWPTLLPPAAPDGESQGLVPDWDVIADLCRRDWSQRMKSSSASHYLAALAALCQARPPRTEEAMQAWLLEKTPGSRPFLTRLEFLGQVRKALTAVDPLSPPDWIHESWLRRMRELHGSRRAKRSSDINGIRGIPTQQEAEEYLDRIGRDHPLEQWCLAFQFCYGLRNHELWWCSPVTEAGEDRLPGWTLVPGWWRTKSKEEHWVWPVFPAWIERYELAVRLPECQTELHRRKRPRLVSALDQARVWRPGNPADPGLCVNNHYLGEFISRRLRRDLPPWMARVPDTDGLYRGSDPPVQITPYDLRHAWAITVATSPTWRHVRDEDAARAMGHDVEIHRRRYQRWIGADQRRRRAMEAGGGQPLPPLLARSRA